MAGGYFPAAPAAVGVLLGAGADPNDTTGGDRPETPLHWAASTDDVDVAVALIDGGADLEELTAEAAGDDDEISKAFWHACSGAQRRAAEYLLSKGADLNWVPDYAEGTPLDAARGDGTRRENVTTWLAELGARSSQTGG